MINTKRVKDQHKNWKKLPFDDKKLYEFPSFELQIYATHKNVTPKSGFTEELRVIPAP